jgi:molybdopterin converting factor subunit 1
LVEGDLHCTVLFFGSAAEIVGSREVTITMPIGSTAGDLFEVVTSKLDGFATLEDCCAFALNSQLCSKNTPLQQDCTLAFLPPVSGG